MCNYLHHWGPLCLFVPAWVRKGWIIYSLRGHLLTESTPLTGPRQNGSLTRLLLYIAAVMGASLEVLLLLICAPLPRSEHFARRLSPPGNSWCIIAAADQSISPFPALPSLCSRCLPGQWFLRLRAPVSWCQGMPVHLHRQLGKSLTERAPCWSPPPSANRVRSRRRS